MKLALQLSCYNGARYLPHLFASLKKQTLQDWHLYVFDNASDEMNAQQIREAVEASGIPITLDRVEKNIGFAGAHSFLFEKHTHTADAIQLLNDDAILEPEFLEKCFTYLERHPQIGAVSGRIFRWNFDRKDESDQGKTEIVDSVALDFSWNGFVSDRGAGQPIQSLQIPKETYFVTGVSGCLPMYRVEAVKRVSPDGSLFDRSYICYKEDCDLALRLQAGGYMAAVVQGAIAYHRRTFGQEGNSIKSLARPTNTNAYWSYRNHLWMLLTNLPLLSLLTNRIGIVPFEILKGIYWLIRQPQFVFNAIRETGVAWPRLMQRRAFIQRLRHEPRRQRPPLPSEAQCDLAIIMVSHNDLSEDCLRSIVEARKRSSLKIKLVVVDNQSTKYRANEFVEQFFDDAWTLLRNGDFGYGRSMNRGAKQVDAKYYFILNPDTILPDPEIFNKIYAYMESHPDVGLMGPKINNFNGVLQETCRRFPALYQPLIQRTSLKNTAFGKKYTKHFLMQDLDHSQESPVDWVQGSAMCLPGTLWKSLGGFDDRYWLYFEDIDLCRRVWVAGKRVMYVPHIMLQHAHMRQSALIQNIFLNLLKTKETRGHLISWIKYVWKWKGCPEPKTW